MTRNDRQAPKSRPLLGLFLMVAGTGALFMGLYLLSGLLLGLAGDSVFAGLGGGASLLAVGGLMLALPGAGAAWIGWRLLTR